MIISTNEISPDNLIERIEQLHLGETMTLISTNGQPFAIVVGVKPASPQSVPAAEWRKQWEDLAQRVGEAWQSEKNAIELVSEMRR
jgi:hypothetical protein